jgi:hypothetical protein
MKLHMADVRQDPKAKGSTACQSFTLAERTHQILNLDDKSPHVAVMCVKYPQMSGHIPGLEPPVSTLLKFGGKLGGLD